MCWLHDLSGSHSELAGDERNWYWLKQTMLCTKFTGPKVDKCNQRNWSPFKQTLKTSPHKPSTSYTIDRFEKRSHWCREADGRAEATQLYFCVKFLNIIKLFLETSVQDKHEDFIKNKWQLITALFLAVAPISPLAAEIWGPRLTALYPIRVITVVNTMYLQNSYN